MMRRSLAFVACFLTLVALAWAGNGITGYGTSVSSWDAMAGVGIQAAHSNTVARNHHQLQAFDDTTDMSILFRGVCPAGYDASQSFTLEVHWISEDATSGDVLWNYRFERDAANDLDLDSPGFAGSVNVTSAAIAGSGKVIIASWTVNNSSFDGTQPGDAFVMQIGRDADSSGTGTDNMTNDAQLFKIYIIWN